MPNSKQLLDISKRAFEKGELDITEKFLGKAIRKQKIEDAASKRDPEPYYNLAEVLQQKASKVDVQLPERQKLLLQTAALYNFARNCLNKNTIESEFATNLLKCLPQKILNVQNSIILAAGGNPSCCKFNSESKGKAVEQLRKEAKNDLEVINAKYDSETGSDEELRKIFIKQATEIRILFQKIASRVKHLLKEIIQECVDVLGDPPCDYEVILLGSLAREEMTPYSDLEWAILTNSEEEECKIFFRNLTNLVHFQIINLGETILPCMDIEVLRGDWFYDDVTLRGLSFDALLPQACKTPLGNTLDFELIHNPVTMANFQSKYWHKKDPNLGDILLTVAPLYDDKHSLLNEYKTNVEKILRQPCDSESCTHDVLSTIPTRGACRGRSILLKDADRYAQTMLDNYKAYDGKLYDVKKEIYRLTDRMVAGLSKVFCVSTNGSFEIVDELCERNVICSSAKDNLASAIAIALKLRLSTYLLAEKQEEAIKAKSNEAAVTNNAISAYHITREKELFHFFYVSTPLCELLCRFCTNDKNSSEDFVTNLFFDCSDVIKGHTCCRILNYVTALDCYKRAIDADPESIDLQLRQMRIEFLLKKNLDVVPLTKSKLDALLQKMHENSNLDPVLAEEGGGSKESVAGKCEQKFRNQLIEIYLLKSQIIVYEGDVNNARVILEQCKKIGFDLSNLQKLNIRLALMKISHNQLTHTEFDDITSQLTALFKDEGISVRGLVWLNELGEFLVHQRKDGEAYQCLQRALTMGHALFGSNLNFSVVLTLYWLGTVCVNLSLYEEGKFYFEQILTLLPPSKDNFFVMLIKDVYRQLAIVSFFTDNHEDAISYFEKTLDLGIRGTSVNLVIDCLTYRTMATTWSKLGESEKAWKAALDAKDCITNNLDIQQKVSLTCSVSQTFMEMGKSDEAMLLLNQGLANENDAALKVKYLNSLGELCAQQGLTEDAECFYKNALEILRSKNENTLDILPTLVDISKVLIKNKKSSEAVSYLNDASKYVSTMIDNNERYKYLKTMAECWEELEEYYVARKCLEQAIKVCTISARNPKVVPYNEFDLHVKLGDLVEKVLTISSSNARGSSISEKNEQIKKAQRMHYDRAGVALRQHLATGYFNSTTVHLFALLAWKYHSIDLLEEEKLLLEALKMSEEIYGQENANELVASILSDLADVYQTKKDYKSAMDFLDRSLGMEMEIHSLDPYHHHINQNLTLLNGLFLEYPQRQQLETTMQRVLIFLEPHNEGEAFTNSVGKASCLASMVPLCFFSGDFEKAEKFNQIASDIFATVQKDEIPQNVLPNTASCFLTSMLSNIRRSISSSNTPSSVSRTESGVTTSFHNEGVLRDCSVSEKAALTSEGSADSLEEVSLSLKSLGLNTITTINSSFQNISVGTDVINKKEQLPTPHLISRKIFQENNDDVPNVVQKSQLYQNYTALPKVRNGDSNELKVSDNSQFSHPKLSNGTDQHDEVNTVHKSEEEDHDAKSTLSKRIESECENISSMGDSVLYEDKQGELGLALKTTKDSLHPLVASFYEKLSSDPVQSLINEAQHARKDRNIFGMISSIDIASKFPTDCEKKAKISKLTGECQLYMQNYRMAAISFGKAVCFHRSVSTGLELDHYVEYAESLIGLTKSHLLCNDAQNAWCACQEGVAISSIQPQLMTSRLLVELLYLAAKCTLQLSTHLTHEQDLEQVVSFCQQALGMSEDVDHYSGSNDPTEELGLEKGEFFALKCEIKLLMASTLFRQKKLEEAQKIVKELKEFLQNLAVVLGMFSKDTWPAGIDDFSKILRRLFSWIGRALVISDETENALNHLTKSLAIVLAPASPEAMLPVEEIVTLLDAITAAISITSQEESCCSFQHTLEVCKRQFLKQNERLKELWEFFATVGNHYVDCDRTKEAIIIYKTGLAVAECMECNDRNEICGQTLLYLANAYRLQAIKKLGKGVSEEHRLAEKYYQSDNGNGTENSSILKKIMYAYFLWDERRFEEATIVLKQATVGDSLWSRNVICLYSKSVLFGSDIQRYITSYGELQTNMGNLAYSLLVRAYVQLGDKKGAIEAYDKLSTDGKDLPTSFGFITSCLPYLLEICEKYLVSLVEGPRKFLFDESDFPLSAGNLAKLYYELGEYGLPLNLREKAKISTGSTSTKETEFFDEICIAHLAANTMVMSGGSYACYHYKTFLEMLQQKEKILDKSFDEQQAILSQYSFPEPYYVYHLLGMMLEEKKVDSRIACYEHCLRLNPVYDIDQNLVGSLADLYQTKAFTEGKDDKLAYQQWINKAQSCFQKLLNMGIKMTPFVESTYASFLYRTKRFDEAISHFEQVIASVTDDDKVIYSEVDIPLSGVHLAREIQARGKVSLPSKIDVYYQMVQVYLECGKLEKARESVLQMEEYIKNFTSSLDYCIVHPVLAYTYKVTGNERKASEIFQAVLDKEPDNEPVKLALKECHTFEQTTKSCN